jgi:hypothetical protein
MQILLVFYILKYNSKAVKAGMPHVFAKKNQLLYIVSEYMYLD